MNTQIHTPEQMRGIRNHAMTVLFHHINLHQLDGVTAIDAPNMPTTDRDRVRLHIDGDPATVAAWLDTITVTNQDGTTTSWGRTRVVREATLNDTGVRIKLTTYESDPIWVEGVGGLVGEWIR